MLNNAIVLYINDIFEKGDITDNTLYNTLLVFSGLTKSHYCQQDDSKCGPHCSLIYSFFILFMLLLTNVDIILFNFTFNPYDISIFIYYFFFLCFFIYARYFYNIEEHYSLLINLPIITDDQHNINEIENRDVIMRPNTRRCNRTNKEQIKCLIRWTTFILCTLSTGYWITDTYYRVYDIDIFNPRGNRVISYYKHTDLININIYNYIYIPLLRLSTLYTFLHILCYIVNITFVFNVHKYQLRDFNNKLKGEYRKINAIISDFNDIRDQVKESVHKIGSLMNMGIACVLFKLPLEILDILIEKNIIMLIPFIINSICFFYGIYQAARINDYNAKFVRAFYKNENLRDNYENVEYIITFFDNNKIFFKVMGTSPTTETLVKIILVVVNVGLSLISGIISNKLM